MAQRFNKRMMKDEKYIDIDDDDVVEIEDEDGQKRVEIESEEEHEEEVESGEESEDDNLNEFVKRKRTSAKKSVKKGDKTAKNKAIMKKLDPKKCVNYLGMPVCPECGSPNLEELGEKDGKKYWVCVRCYTPCWTGVSEDYDASAKKSTKKSKLNKEYRVNAGRDIDIDIMAGELTVRITDTDSGWAKNKQIDVMNLPWGVVGDITKILGENWDDIPQFVAIENSLVEKYDEHWQEVDRDLHEKNGWKSARKSRDYKLHKRLNKLGGFTKEDDDDEGNDILHADDPIDEGYRDYDDGDEEEDYTRYWSSRRKSRKTKKAGDMPSDADDFKEDNQKGSGNAGSELPEDADENQEINEKGSGNAGSELPEDADEQQEIKQSRRKSARKYIRKTRPVRKYSVTNGGSPDQTSYAQRYQQSPMVRQAIDRGAKVEKYDEVSMLQDRLNNLSKSKRIPYKSGVPQRLR